MYKNIEKQKILELEKEIEYSEGQVVSKTLVQNELVSITLFSFSKGEEISSHKSGGDALVTILDGNALITIDGKKYHLKKGESIVMEKGLPHALFAESNFKMILVVSF